MADITLTDTSPVVAKAAGGGSPQWANLIDANPAIDKSAGGGSREMISLLDYSPLLGGNQGRAGFNPIFEALL